MKREKNITMAHGNGGVYTHRLITELFRPAFGEEESDFSDGAILKPDHRSPVISTDSFVVSPIFFPGGDLGSLAVYGTVNDIAVSGGDPLYLSAGFIIEEGFLVDDLIRISRSMAEAARVSGVRIVTGDTKVVERGACDGIFINTTGFGYLREDSPAGLNSMKPGDKIILSGYVGDHGMALYAIREGMDFHTDLESDCGSVSEIARVIQKTAKGSLRIMRDPTRGGLATTLNEFFEDSKFSGEIYENRIPIRDAVKGLCELLGFDPLHVANEGKLVAIVDSNVAEDVIQKIRKVPGSENASIIGDVTDRMPGRVILKTAIGGERILDMLAGDMLPRIC